MGISKIFYVRYSDLKGWQRLALKGTVELLDKLTIGLSLASFYVVAYLGTAEHRWGLTEAALVVWGVAEILFRMYVFMRIVKADKNRPASSVEGYERVALAKKLSDHIQEINELKEWFEPRDSFTKDSLNTFIIAVFFGKDENELSEDELNQAK